MSSKPHTKEETIQLLKEQLGEEGFQKFLERRVLDGITAITRVTKTLQDTGDTLDGIATIIRNMTWDSSAPEIEYRIFVDVFVSTIHDLRGNAATGRTPLDNAIFTAQFAASLEKFRARYLEKHNES